MRRQRYESLKTMTEDFLHFVWKFKMLIPPIFLKSGEEVHILSSGIHNHDAGPDFFNAQIRFGNTRWAGNVEIHINASDWYKHNHQDDPAYDNIILHVVYHADQKVYRRNKESIPTLELYEHIDENLLNKYLMMIGSPEHIPCKNIIKEVNPLVIRNMFERSLIERLEQKSIFILNKLVQNKYNWEQSFYEHLAGSFGLKVNAEAFELLAKSLPVKYLAKHRSELLQLEAMLFGQAGFLSNKYKDSYPNELKAEYLHLQRKFSFKPISLHHWKFLRLRPSNFPGIRISQFADLIHQSFSLFSRMLEVDDVHQLHQMLKVKASEYWNIHYRFDSKSIFRPKTKSLGEGSRTLIMINTMIPFLFVYGTQKSDRSFCNRALQFLEDIRAENNKIIRIWKTSGIPVDTAFESQALLQLFNHYCRNKKCLDCKIGINLLGS